LPGRADVTDERAAADARVLSLPQPRPDSVISARGRRRSGNGRASKQARP